MRTLRITTTASQDLNEISDYFLMQSIEAGDRFVTSFSQKCLLLARYPHIGKSYGQLKEGLRGLSLMNYIIFYRTIGNDVEILRVVSGYRNFQDIFQE